jgi:hypothetical protein
MQSSRVIGGCFAVWGCLGLACSSGTSSQGGTGAFPLQEEMDLRIAAVQVAARRPKAEARRQPGGSRRSPEAKRVAAREERARRAARLGPAAKQAPAVSHPGWAEATKQEAHLQAAVPTTEA